MIEKLIRDAAIIFSLIPLKKSVSSYQLAKRIFGVNGYELKKKDIWLRKWFRKYARLGLFEEKVVDGKTYYTIKHENVVWGNGKIFVKTPENQTLEIDLGKIFMLRVKEKWLIFQLE